MTNLRGILSFLKMKRKILIKLAKELDCIDDYWDHFEPDLEDATFQEIVQYQEAKKLDERLSRKFKTGFLTNEEELIYHGVPEDIPDSELRSVFYPGDLANQMLLYSQCGAMGRGLLFWAHDYFNLKFMMFNHFTTMAEYYEYLCRFSDGRRLPDLIESKWWIDE